MDEISHILLTADIHGDFGLLKNLLKEYEEKKGIKLNDKDKLIVCGDFGFLWEFEKYYYEEYILKQLEGLGPEILFIDGNHENYTRLNKLPIENKYGAPAGKVSDKIFHLKRGNIYSINNATFFAFGGARSSDKEKRKEYWWPQELPSEEEKKYGLQNLKMNSFKVNYILTHEGPFGVVNMMDGILRKKTDIELSELYFEKEIRRNVEYDQWIFGHYHIRKNIDKHTCLYQNILELSPNIS